MVAFRGTFYRSVIPVLAASVALAGWLGGCMLAVREEAAMSRAEVCLDMELRNSGYRDLRERLVRQHKVLLAEHRRLGSN